MHIINISNLVTFNFNGGVQSFVRSLNRKRNPVHENVIIIQGSADPYSNKSKKGVKKESAPVKVEIALQYNETFPTEDYSSPVLRLKRRRQIVDIFLFQ